MITSPPKRGMALVVVLVLLAVMMLVTITLSGRMQQQLGRTRSQQEYQQALAAWQTHQRINHAAAYKAHSFTLRRQHASARQ